MSTRNLIEIQGDPKKPENEKRFLYVTGETWDVRKLIEDAFDNFEKKDYNHHSVSTFQMHIMCTYNNFENISSKSVPSTSPFCPLSPKEMLDNIWGWDNWFVVNITKRTIGDMTINNIQNEDELVY